MTTFRIDAENNITALGGSEQIEESGGKTETFGNLRELTALAEKWSAARLVEIWSSLPGVQPVGLKGTEPHVSVPRFWTSQLVHGSPLHEPALSGPQMAAKSKAFNDAPLK